MKTYTLADTRHPKLKRVVDRKGNWQRYLQIDAKEYLDGITTILRKGYPKGEGFEAWLAKHTEDERDSILSESSDRGDMVHRVIEMMLTATEPMTLSRQHEVFSRGGQQERALSDQEWDLLLTFQRFWVDHEPIVYASEGSVYQLGKARKTRGYAGTFDAILVLTKKCASKYCKCAKVIGKLGTWDYKTGKGIYADHGAQVAALTFSQNITDYCPTVPEYGATLALNTKHKSGYTFEVWIGDELKAKYADFRAAQRLAAIPPFKADEEIRDIPDTITLTVKKFQPEVVETEEQPAAKEATVSEEKPAPKKRAPRTKKSTTKKTTTK